MAFRIGARVPVSAAIIFAELESDGGPCSPSLRIVRLDIVDNKVGHVRYSTAYLVGLRHQLIEAGTSDANDHNQCVIEPELGVSEVPLGIAIHVGARKAKRLAKQAQAFSGSR